MRSPGALVGVGARASAGALAFLLLASLALSFPARVRAEEPVTTLPGSENPAIPPGAFVLFETHRLYYHCEGEGSPTVLIDGGIADTPANWEPVQSSLAATFRTCVYDRAGYGMSDPGPGVRTSEQIAWELHTLARLAGLPGPFLLVGHSFGGYTMQLFAKRYPRDVMGMVLVESSHPDQVERLADLDRYGTRVTQLVAGRSAAMLQEMSPWQRHWHDLNTRRKAIFAQMDELKAFRESAEEVRDAGPLPDIPLVVLTRGQSLLPVMENGHAMEGEWLAMQAELARATPRATQVVVPGAGHNIHMDNPAAVVDAVRAVVAQAGE